MTAGLQYTEMRRLSPGFIMDMFRFRLDYDSKLAGVGMLKKSIGGMRKRSEG